MQFFFLSISKSLKNIRSVETQPTWNIKLFGENNNKSNARDAIFFFFYKLLISRNEKVTLIVGIYENQ